MSQQRKNEVQDYKEVPLAEIKPYENNPRNNSQAIDSVAKSIKDFGFQQPIVVDRKMVIIAGHTRYLAAKRLGLKTVPVKVANLTEEQANAYRLVDNKVSELSFWDNEKLFDELANIDMDLSDFGFDVNLGGEELIPLEANQPLPSPKSNVVENEDNKPAMSEWLSPVHPETSSTPPLNNECEVNINANSVERSTRIEHSLKIDSIRIFMTEDEYDSIVRKYNEYVGKNGVSYGFVRSLCNS